MTSSPIRFALAFAIILAALPARAQTAGTAPAGGSTGLSTGSVNTGGVSPLVLPQPAPLSTAASTTTSGVEVGNLGSVTPDYGGTLEEGGGGFPLDMWKGTDRALVERLLPQLPAAPSSPAMRDLARRLLLTNAEAPTGQATINLFGVRADRLAAMGLFSDAAALLALQPVSSVDATSARLRIKAQLLAGDGEGACKTVDDTRKVASADVDWQKTQVFCQLRSGKADQAALGIEILRDQNQNDPAFFKLAEAMGGDKSVAIVSLPDPSPLDLAMLQAAGLPLPPDAARATDPAVLAAVAQDSTVDPAIRLAAAEQAAAAGSLSIDKLQQAYANVAYAPADIGNAIDISSHDPGPGGRALLFQAAGVAQQPADRAHVLQAALDRARRQGGYILAVRTNLLYLLPLQPSPDLIWFAADAGRALYASGHFEQANAWLQTAQDKAASDPQAAAAASALAVYARIAGVGQPLFWDAAAVQKWRQAQAAGGSSADPVNRLFAVFEGIGEPIGGSWTLIGQTAASGGAPDPALWFNLGDAANNGRIGETVLLSLCALGEGGPASANPILLSRAISSLRQVGLDAEARAIAIEAAIAAGV